MDAEKWLTRQSMRTQCGPLTAAQRSSEGHLLLLRLKSKHMTRIDDIVELVSRAGVKITFDSYDCDRLEIFEAESAEPIGYLEVDDRGMFVGANIQSKYQRKGIATVVVRYLVEHCGREFYFWRPDGQTYDDGRHLSVEGAELANSLIQAGLASWIDNDPYRENEGF